MVVQLRKSEIVKFNKTFFLYIQQQIIQLGFFFSFFRGWVGL